MDHYHPITKKSFLYGLLKYFYALIPLITLSAYVIFNAYYATSSRMGRNFHYLDVQQIIATSNMIFWSGVILSGTMITILAINDCFDLVLRLLHKPTK